MTGFSPAVVHACHVHNCGLQKPVRTTYPSHPHLCKGIHWDLVQAARVPAVVVLLPHSEAKVAGIGDALLQLCAWRWCRCSTHLIVTLADGT